MPTAAEAVSPSLSVIVATSWIAPSLRIEIGWLGPVSGECWSARTWSRVTLPEASTVTLNETVEPALAVVASVPALPTTPEPLLNRKMCWPVATSISPESVPLVVVTE